MKVLLKLTKPGRIVPDILTGKPVPPEGLEVRQTDGKFPRYWRRRIKDGDVKVATAPARTFPPQI